MIESVMRGRTEQMTSLAVPRAIGPVDAAPDLTMDRSGESIEKVSRLPPLDHIDTAGGATTR